MERWTVRSQLGNAAFENQGSWAGTAWRHFEKTNWMLDYGYWKLERMVIVPTGNQYARCRNAGTSITNQRKSTVAPESATFSCGLNYLQYNRVCSTPTLYLYLRLQTPWLQNSRVLSFVVVLSPRAVQVCGLGTEKMMYQLGYSTFDHSVFITPDSLDEY